jgi:hypothetical protein
MGFLLSDRSVGIFDVQVGKFEYQVGIALFCMLYWRVSPTEKAFGEPKASNRGI